MGTVKGPRCGQGAADLGMGPRVAVPARRLPGTRGRAAATGPPTGVGDWRRQLAVPLSPHLPSTQRPRGRQAPQGSGPCGESPPPGPGAPGPSAPTPPPLASPPPRAPGPPPPLPWQPREPPGALSSAGALDSGGGGSSDSSRARCDLSPEPARCPRSGPGPPAWPPAGPCAYPVSCPHGAAGCSLQRRLRRGPRQLHLGERHARLSNGTPARQVRPGSIPAPACQSRPCVLPPTRVSDGRCSPTPAAYQGPWPPRLLLPPTNSNRRICTPPRETSMS